MQEYHRKGEYIFVCFTDETGPFKVGSCHPACVESAWYCNIRDPEDNGSHLVSRTFFVKISREQYTKYLEQVIHDLNRRDQREQLNTMGNW